MPSPDWRGLPSAATRCSTSTRTGTYLVFVETTGELDDVRGDCDADTDIDWTSDELPTVTLTLVDPDGDDGRTRRRTTA